MIKKINIYFRMQSLKASSLLDSSHHSYKGEPLKRFPRFVKGSVTVEGTFALSLCFFVFAAILMFFNLLGGQTKKYIEADELSQREAVYAGVVGGDFGDTATFYEYSDKVALLPDNIRNYFFYGEIIRKPWTGRSLNDVADEDGEEYVFVAENASVYHTTESCTHLKLSISDVSYSDIASIRNQYGDRYTKCELCGDNCGERVFVGAEGDRYHSTNKCSGLKRTYSKVKKSECSLPACSRCGG